MPDNKWMAIDANKQVSIGIDWNISRLASNDWFARLKESSEQRCPAVWIIVKEDINKPEVDCNSLRVRSIFIS